MNNKHWPTHEATQRCKRPSIVQAVTLLTSTTRGASAFIYIHYQMPLRRKSLCWLLFSHPCFLFVHTAVLSFAYFYVRYTALPPQDRGSYHGSGGVEASIDQDTGDDISDVEVAINPRYAGGGAEADALLPEALNLLRNAVETEAKKRSKSVSSLLLRSAHVARLMHGARTTSCKSAKDRTSVFQTLEVVRLADPTRGPALFTPQGLRQSAPLRTISKTGSSKDVELDSGRKDNESIDSIRSDNVDDDYNANDDDAAGGGSRSNKNDVMSGSAAAADERTALNTLRGIEGVRLRNAELNMGRFKYAFNKLQLEALPQELRPPAHTASGGKS